MLQRRTIATIRTLRALAVAAAVAAVTALWPVRTHAQSVVRSVEMSADLTAGDGSAAVHVEIVFVPDDTSGVRLELLGFANAMAEEFRSGGADGPVIRFAGRTGSRAWIVIERGALERAGLRPAPLDDTRVWHLIADYVVDNAVVRDASGVRARVPVLTVALPPVRASGDVFRARVVVPPDWIVVESFPTGLRETPDSEYDVRLAVAPSVISLRARSDGAWRPGVPLILDVVAGIILLVFLVFGWRHVRQATSAEGDVPTGIQTRESNRLRVHLREPGGQPRSPPDDPISDTGFAGGAGRAR
jgi:hypothetical protein